LSPVKSHNPLFLQRQTNSITAAVTTKIYTHPLLGDILITKKGGNRNIRLTVSPSKGIRVSVPFFTKFSHAEDFIREREDWIIETIKKQEEKVHSRMIPLGEGHDIQLVGSMIIFHKDNTQEALKRNKIAVRISGDKTEIHYPDGCTREALSGIVIKMIKRRAAEYLPQRCATLASEHGFKYNRIFMKNNRTNWGSCSNRGNINLNIHLMRLDKELADYVILHELCHLRHHNHGAGFHTLLNALCGGKEKELASQLRSKNTSALSAI